MRVFKPELHISRPLLFSSGDLTKRGAVD